MGPTYVISLVMSSSDLPRALQQRRAGRHERSHGKPQTETWQQHTQLGTRMSVLNSRPGKGKTNEFPLQIACPGAFRLPPTPRRPAWPSYKVSLVMFASAAETNAWPFRLREQLTRTMLVIGFRLDVFGWKAKELRSTSTNKCCRMAGGHVGAKSFGAVIRLLMTDCTSSQIAFVT